MAIQLIARSARTTQLGTQPASKTVSDARRGRLGKPEPRPYPNPNLSCSGDGMAFDCGGRLYVTKDQAVRVIDTTNENFPEVASIHVPGVQAVTNVAFGGPQRTTLYVTSLGTNPRLFRVELGVVGFPY